MQPGHVALLSGAFPRGGAVAFMSYRSRSGPRPSSRSAPVMAIGRRVFVNAAAGRSGSVVLGDVNGDNDSAILADGTEVEVIAWRPRGATNTRYRVRSPLGVDGWLSAESLRQVLVPPPPVESPAPPSTPAAAVSGGRRIGHLS